MIPGKTETLDMHNKYHIKSFMNICANKKECMGKNPLKLALFFLHLILVKSLKSNYRLFSLIRKLKVSLCRKISLLI